MCCLPCPMLMYVLWVCDINKRQDLWVQGPWTGGQSLGLILFGKYFLCLLDTMEIAQNKAKGSLLWQKRELTCTELEDNESLTPGQRAGLSHWKGRDPTACQRTEICLSSQRTEICLSSQPGDCNRSLRQWETERWSVW